MSWRARFSNLFRTQALSAEVERELAFHVAERTDELMAQGYSEIEARREARKLFGNYSLQLERTREMNLVAWLESAWSDTLFGLRQLRLNPGFTAVAVLSLGLGIGANTAIFQLLDAMRLRGLAVENPSQLVTVGRERGSMVAGAYRSRNVAFTYPQAEAIRHNQRAFSDFLLFNDSRFNLSAGGQPRYAAGLFVSNNFLRLLGVKPVIGHDLTPGSDRVCNNPGALVSYDFWQREFGGRFSAIGQNIRLDGYPLPIAAVLPPTFKGVEPGLRFDLAVPMCALGLISKDSANSLNDKTDFRWTIIGRLNSGWNLNRADQHFHNISAAVYRESLPADYRPDDAAKYLKNRLKLESGSAGVSELRRQYEDPLVLLLCLTGLVLLIACANLANLLLARASVRERELAVRQALGASRVRLVTQLMSESLLLALAGGAAGLVMAILLSRTLVMFLAGSRTDDVALNTGLDLRLLLFTFGLASLTCLLFGLLPALRASGSRPADGMRGARTSTASREKNGLRRLLVISQVALSLILLVAALLFSGSLQKLLSIDTGFRTENVLVAEVSAPQAQFPSAKSRAQLFRGLQAQLQSVPAVKTAATMGFVPFSHQGWNGTTHADTDASATGGKISWFNRVGPGYFGVMGLRLSGGRDFRDSDDLRSPKIAVINKTLARQLFGQASPVGRTFRVEGDAHTPDLVYQIVGVVPDAKQDHLSEDPQPVAYFPTNQDPEVGDQQRFVLNIQGSPEAVSRAVLHQVTALNPSLLVEFKLLSVQVQQSLFPQRLMASLTAAFGFLAAALSTLGLYGVMSYLVARRRSEIGVRIALGADRRNVLSLVLRDALSMVVVGLVAGVTAAILLSRYAESMLFQLKANDPPTIGLSIALLLSTAIGATLIPANRAARLSPSTALRQE